MKRCVLACVLGVGLAILAAAESATAQVYQNQPNPYAPPAVSPYLNLARPGPGGINYYGLTKPQLDVNRQLQALQLQQQGLMQQLGVVPEDAAGFPSAYAITGHSTAFGDSSPYFGQPGGGVRPAQPPATVPRKN